MLYQYDLASHILAHVHSTFWDAMCKWDCKWYITIIESGYDAHVRLAPKVWKGLANWAFFPLYPYLVKFISNFTSYAPVVIGIVLNQVLIFISLLVFYRYLRLRLDELNSRYGVLLLAFSPFSIYFASLYTEALFLLLSLLSFYYLRTKRPWMAAICGGLLSATRPVGMMFSIPFFLYQIRHSRYFIALVGGVVAISGLLIYMIFLHYRSGDYLAFMHIQHGWGRRGFDTTHWVSELFRLLKDTHNAVLFLLSFAFSLYLIFHKYFEEGVFNLLCILPGVMTGQMMSEGRFSGTLFTFYLALTLITRKSSSLKLAVGAVFFLFYISYFLYWMAKATFLI